MTASDVTLRPARLDEISRLQDIERRAAERFAEVGLPEAATLPIMDTDSHAQAIRDGRVLVATVPELAGDTPLAFAMIERFSDAVHLREIDVAPEGARRGLGARLIDRIVADARAEGALAVTLTTFRDIPFNAPYYTRLGFVVLDERGLPPRLAALRAAERAYGVDLVPRVAMMRDLLE